MELVATVMNTCWLIVTMHVNRTCTIIIIHKQVPIIIIIITHTQVPSIVTCIVAGENDTEAKDESQVILNVSCPSGSPSSIAVIIIHCIIVELFDGSNVRG